MSKLRPEPVSLKDAMTRNFMPLGEHSPRIITEPLVDEGFVLLRIKTA